MRWHGQVKSVAGLWEPREPPHKGADSAIRARSAAAPHSEPAAPLPRREPAAGPPCGPGQSWAAALAKPSSASKSIAPGSPCVFSGTCMWPQIPLNAFHRSAPIRWPPPFPADFG